MHFPFVSIIMVNYNGKHLLEESLAAISKLKYPKNKIEVIIVDNNSNDDSVPFIKKAYPQHKLIQSSTNTGFTGGNNLGFNEAKGEYLILLNTDVTVEPLWLENLVKAAEDKAVGIISSRLRYAIPFVELHIKSLAVPRSQLTASVDHSPVGILLEDIKCEREELDELVFYRDGFYPSQIGELATRRIKGSASVSLPMPQNLETFAYTFTIHGFDSKSLKSIPVEFYVGNEIVASTHVSMNEVKQITITLDQAKIKKHLRWYIQNAGNVVLSNGLSKDRGSVLDLRDPKQKEFYEEENAFYDKPAELLAACGAACLIKRAVIDHVGFLDGHYFMYYEDIEFSIRAWRAGWKIKYEPQAIAYHKHRATTGKEESAFLIMQTEKNHLALVVSHFPLEVAIREIIFFSLKCMMTALKAFLFQFRDDIDRTRVWHRKNKGRRGALIFLVTNILRLGVQRWRFNQYWPVNRSAMAKMLY